MNQLIKVFATAKIRTPAGDDITKINDFSFFYDENNIAKSKSKFVTAAQDSWDMLQSNYMSHADDDVKNSSWKEEAYALISKDRRWFVKNSNMECVEQVRIPETWKDV